MTDNIHRLHRALVDAMLRTRGEDFERPITVSQIYQELVPYRVARSSVGFEMNADYEFALLRLLAGDGDLARLEPPEIRTMLRKEAESPNPNVSLFRAYANCDVWISPPKDWVAEMVDELELESESGDVHFDFEPEQEGPQSGEPIEAYDFVPDDTPEPQPQQPRKQEVPLPEIISTGPAPTAGGHPQHCAFCGGNLPATRLVNFCPHCGGDLTQQPCSSCGEILDSSWRFCVNCGTPAGRFDSQAN
jgi:hypothetical protein